MKTPSLLTIFGMAFGLAASAHSSLAFQERSSGGVRDGGGLPLPPGYALLPPGDFAYDCKLTLKDFQTGRVSTTSFTLDRSQTGMVTDQAKWEHFKAHMVTGRLIPTAELPTYALIQHGVVLRFHPIYGADGNSSGWNVDLELRLNVDEPLRRRSVGGFARQPFSVPLQGTESLAVSVTAETHTPRGDERFTGEASCVRTK